MNFYFQILRIKKSNLIDGIAGQAINIMSNDALKFDTSVCFLQSLYQGPVEVIILSFFIYKEIGMSGLLGIAFMLCFMPLQIWMGIMTGEYRKRTVKETDIRIRLMSEIINGIQVIKMYAWEIPFGKIIKKIRADEIKQIRGSLLIRGTLVVFTIVSRFAIFFSLVSYIYFGNDRAFSADKVFIITSYFNMLYTSMLHFWPVALFSTAEVLVSIRRIQKFLLHPETKYERKSLVYKQKQNLTNKILGKHKSEFFVKEENPMIFKSFNAINLEKRFVHENSSEKNIIFKNATAHYIQDRDDKIMGVKNVNLEINDGETCAVIGSVGCGKSTLLQVILGELELDVGSITVNGSISYASQDPWIFEGSVRGNIIFTEEYNERRYSEVLRICALEHDINLLPDRDFTIVGERGVSLSGGQRARVNLARAVYRQADIYLLDDPLSALDAEVGRHIFANCIRDFLQVCLFIKLYFFNYNENIFLHKIFNS